MDDFFKKTRCDRCHGSLDRGRIMSMFNDYVINNISVVML